MYFMINVSYFNFSITTQRSLRGGADASDTVLQAGKVRVRFSMVSLAYLTNTILPAALWL
jgi:Fe-S cluster assembly iron-binding protein IscA